MTLVYKVKSALSLTFKCPPFSSHSLELWRIDIKETQLLSLSPVPPRPPTRATAVCCVFLCRRFLLIHINVLADDNRGQSRSRGGNFCTSNATGGRETPGGGDSQSLPLPQEGTDGRPIISSFNCEEVGVLNVFNNNSFPPGPTLNLGTTYHDVVFYMLISRFFSSLKTYYMPKLWRK